MPRKSKTKDPDQFKIKVEQDAETIKKTRRRANIPTFKSRPVNDLTQYLIDNEDSGKSQRELTEEFRAECGHSFQEIANLGAENRISIQSCKRCGIVVKGKGAGTKASAKNRLGNGDGEAD